MKRFVEKDDPLGVSRDHLLPRSRGGGSATRNYLLAHRACNGARGAPKLVATRSEIQSMRMWAINRLKNSPRWVEDYQGHGAYRGSRPPPTVSEGQK